jgi:hypothetical protein
MNLLIPKPHKQTKKKPGSGQKEVTTNTDPPTVARSTTHLMNDFIGITARYILCTALILIM